MTAANNRLFAETVLNRYRAGIPWRGLAARFGDGNNLHRRFSRWPKSGSGRGSFSTSPPTRQADMLIGDKAFDADKRVLEPLAAASKAAVIPGKASRREPRCFDRHIYKERHLIGNFFAKLEQFRAIATRYDKTARNFLAAVYLTASAIWLN